MMNMMLARKAELVPYAGELQIEVDRLKEILEPAGLLDRNSVEAAIRERRAAAQATADAKSRLDEVCRRHSAPVNGYGEASEVQAAGAKVAQCEDRRKRAGAAYHRAKERQAEVFLAGVLPQIEQAAPILLEVVRLLNDAINPVRNLYAATVGCDLSMPRLLAAAPTLSEATRILTAALNAATAPNPVSDDIEDEA